MFTRWNGFSFYIGKFKEYVALLYTRIKQGGGGGGEWAMLTFSLESFIFRFKKFGC